jgi:phenylacetate-CoA ligase
MKNIRYYLFWFIDKLNGGYIKKNYDEIKKILINPEEIDSSKIQTQRLCEILSYAIEFSAFYRNLNIKRIELNEFPVIDKLTIKNNIDDFLSDKYKGERKDQLKKMSTSGSTGTPFFVYQDKKKTIRSKADLIFFYELANYYVGNRLYFLRIWNEINKKSKFACIKENYVMTDTSNLSLDNIENFIRLLQKDKKKKVLIGYASSFETIAQYEEKINIGNNNIKSIIPGAESLSIDAKNILKRMFNCPVYMRYSNQENGILAQQIDDTEDYFINEASYKIEFLKLNEDKEADENELSRIVVTDLFNYALPMIRYDTGDLAKYYYKMDIQGKKYRVIKIIEGRKVDFIYDSEGKLVSPHAITLPMWKYANSIKQFQFIQNGEKNYLIKLNVDDIFPNEEQLKTELLKLLGNSADISFEYVNEIPLLNSGKRKKIINNWK